VVPVLSRDPGQIVVKLASFLTALLLNHLSVLFPPFENFLDRNHFLTIRAPDITRLPAAAMPAVLGDCHEHGPLFRRLIAQEPKLAVIAAPEEDATGLHGHLR
jgi:hypothetical protein